MSLVAPRPHAIPHNMMFEAFVANYAARFQMKPGITGWAQINGFRGENRTAETILRRVELDLLYVRIGAFGDFLAAEVPMRWSGELAEKSIDRDAQAAAGHHQIFVVLVGMVNPRQVLWLHVGFQIPIS